MGHLLRLKDEFRDLAARLSEGGLVALVEPAGEEAWRGWQEILEIMYSPEEAALAARMPLLPQDLPALSRRLGVPEQELAARLEPMCDKGIVMDLVSPATGKTKYLLSPPLVGFFEFSLMRVTDSIPKKRMAEALEAYLHGEDTFLRELSGGATPIGRSLVHESALGDSLPDVLDWERASAVIEGASAWAVSLCTCRHKAEHLGAGCDAPRESCLTLNVAAEFVVRRGFGRSIEKSEALEILTRAREHGLVHTADNVQGHPLFVCNCCACCCELFRGANEFGLPAVNPSGFIPRSNPEQCAGCGRCARACPMCAVQMAPRREKDARANALEPRIDPERCIGCGACVTACLKRAMTIVRREQRPAVPVNAVEKVVRTALEHGRLADLVFDRGGGLGARFLHGALAAILALPPAKRLLASEQLRSRFVRAALARIEDPFA